MSVATLSPDLASTDDLDDFAQELDALRDEVLQDLGARDASYIRKVIETQRRMELAGRALLVLSRFRPALVSGTALLTLAKVLENMEIGHNVMHGQWDWMGDPRINSATWEWDAASTAQSWKYAHNYQHHTFTNVVGLDRDLGYSAMRVHPDQPWHPIYLLQPLYGIAMAATFEWGIALYDVNLDAVRRGEKSRARANAELRGLGRKVLAQFAKDYALFPLLSGRSARRTLTANVVANVVRNVWVHTIVFMGHIPEGAETFSPEQVESETRGQWYRRQLTGSCNLEGSRLFHLLSGNLSFQIEHHLFPDLPSNRYAKIAPRVRELSRRHGLAYPSGRLGPQYRSVARKILRYALP